ncbi:MAG: SDR family oxidoreductase [Mastigocoleus sp. MO_167.B18]|nr:SDR family oxidoreductase [Mastigocoleus sp. MO_167.B18]
MNFIIIGCGYVGYALAEHLQQKKTCVVTATTTTPEKISKLQKVAQKALVLKGEDIEGLKSALQNQDTVLLSIARIGNSTYQETYLQTAKNLVRAVKDNPTVKQIIYTSSSSVYGNFGGNLVDEETQIQPTSESGKTLRETEQILLSASNEKLSICILRLAGIYGPNREIRKIYSRFAGKTLPGEGKEAANWIHLDDIVGAIDFASRHRLAEIYNVVDDANLTRYEVIEKVCAEHNLEKIKWDSSLKSSRSSNARVSNQKLKAAGYKLIHPQIIF